MTSNELYYLKGLVEKAEYLQEKVGHIAGMQQAYRDKNAYATISISSTVPGNVDAIPNKFAPELMDLLERIRLDYIKELDDLHYDYHENSEEDEK